MRVSCPSSMIVINSALGSTSLAPVSTSFWLLFLLSLRVNFSSRLTTSSLLMDARTMAGVGVPAAPAGSGDGELYANGSGLFMNDGGAWLATGGCLYGLSWRNGERGVPTDDGCCCCC